MSAKPHLSAQHDQIVRLASSGVAAPDIARILGCCVSGVRKYCARNEIPLVNIKDLFPRYKEAFLERTVVDTNAASLAALFGVSVPTIRRWAKRTGVELTDTYHVGFLTTASGYILVAAPEHPQADSKGYVRLHRLVMETHLGRYLTEEEVVHHKDGDKANNDISNLELMNKREHAKMHAEAGDTGWSAYHANAT